MTTFKRTKLGSPLPQQERETLRRTFGQPVVRVVIQVLLLWWQHGRRRQCCGRLRPPARMGRRRRPPPIMETHCHRGARRRRWWRRQPSPDRHSPLARSRRRRRRRRRTRIHSVPLVGTLHVGSESGSQPFHRRVFRPRRLRPQRGGGRRGNDRWHSFGALCPGASQPFQFACLDVTTYRVLDHLGHSKHGGSLRSGQVLPRVPGNASGLNVGSTAPGMGRR